ncbi:MAG: hypothetical protein QN187_08695 [Armatimonadota bacterium]|nr:hypothetical protein [Armatimonadota bacterium]MDR7520765.1 hypothetical protein [Armatimonadota bacterium]
MLAALAILGLVLAALVPLLSVGGQSWHRVDRHTEMLQHARRAADKMVRDLRAAESLQAVGPTLIRFVTALGDGSGKTPTVEYRLNTTTNELEYRVAADFAYRRRITVTAGGPGVPDGYSVSVAFDHAALVAAGKSLASGDDVRIRYWTGTRWVELDRFRDIPTAWNTTTTRIWFKLQAPIAAGSSDNNYYLHYGDLAAGAPPANGDYVFLDYEDGTTLAGWTRRDSCAGTHSASTDGFVFTASGGNCHRQFSKNVPHGNVEIFWGFWSSPTGSADGHQAGVSARRSDTGAGYVLTLADEANSRLRLRYWTVWSTTGGGVIGSVPASITPGTNYYGRFYLVGSSLRAKYWPVGTAEPGWMLQVTHTTVASGAHYGQVDGYAAPLTHRHRHIIVRQRVATEPTTMLAPEESGARPDAFEPLAGPFSAMTLRCFNASGSEIPCESSPMSSIKSVEVALRVVDPTLEVADVVVTSRAYRQAP